MRKRATVTHIYVLCVVTYRLRKMDTINKYPYPTLRTFKDAIELAQYAIEKYDGIIPVADAARKLGYTIPDSKSVSGTIYKQFNDICMYGLLTRGLKGALQATPLGREALDPFHLDTSILAKAKALRSIELIVKAFDAWGEQIPDDSAFPAKLSVLTGADWAECKSKFAAIKIVIKEAIPYLKASKDIAGNVQEPSNVVTTPSQHIEERGNNMPKGEIGQDITPTNPVIQSKPTGGIEEFVLGEGIRIYLPRDNIKSAWEKTKKALKVLIEETES